MDTCELCDELCEEETFTTLMAGMRLDPEGGATKEEMQTLLDWAHRVHMQQVFLDMLLDGKLVVVGFQGEEPVFGTPEGVDRRNAVTIAERVIRRQEPS